MYKIHIIQELKKLTEETFEEKVERTKIVKREGKDEEITEEQVVKYQLTFGQILLSAASAREDKTLTKMEWFRDVSDKDLYTALTNVKNLENGN